MKPLVDSALYKFFSRKLLVWTIATYAFFVDKLSPEHWFQISAAYIGIQGFADILLKFQNVRNKKDG